MRGVENLAKWINEELERRGWSQRELGRRAGISNTTISKVVSGEIAPTWEFCAAIAIALEERPEKVFRLAGLLPDHGEMKDLSEEEGRLVRIHRGLSIRRRVALLEYAESIFDRYGSKKES